MHLPLNDGVDNDEDQLHVCMALGTIADQQQRPRSGTDALVIIDVQNEFLDPAGHFPIHADCRPELVAKLRALIPRFRQAGGHVIFVQAVYEKRAEEPPAMAAEPKGDGVVATNAWLAAATHVHPVPCCEAGSWGAEIYPEIGSLRDRQRDVVVVKGAYSAFNGTTALLDVLREKGVTDAYFAGCASGTCVLASVLDAVSRGEWKVRVVPDCLGWRRYNTHEEALRRFTLLGVDLVPSENFRIGMPRETRECKILSCKGPGLAVQHREELQMERLDGK